MTLLDNQSTDAGQNSRARQTCPFENDIRSSIISFFFLVDMKKKKKDL